MANPYLLIICFSLLVIFSYGFNIITKYVKIPAVILLMGTGVMIAYVVEYFSIQLPDLFSPLKILGLVGLMMIVLEGALDLKLKKEKWRMIVTSFITASIILAITAFSIAGIIWVFIPSSMMSAFIYAIPLSVVSSAIVIPSVNYLIPAKKEYLIYESTFSDILGIMLFDFMIFVPDPGDSYAWAVSSNILISIVASIVLSYILVLLFQKVRSKLKIFLFLSILALLFSIGKYFHFSALLIILIFGLVLYNHEVFFRGRLKKLINEEAVAQIRTDFRLITEESSFLIRTFFFVVFGMTMELEALMEPQVVIVGALTIAIIYFVRLINLKIFTKTNVFPEISIAPRGLVTVLLFYRIPERFDLPQFNDGILVFVIIATSLIMMLGLITSGQHEEDLDRHNLEPSGPSGENPDLI